MPVEQTSGSGKTRSKSLFQSMTVFSALLMLMAYGGARYAEAPPKCLQSILVVGTALIAIFMRRSLRTRKPLWRSMTLWSSLGMLAAYFGALYEHIDTSV